MRKYYKISKVIDTTAMLLALLAGCSSPASTTATTAPAATATSDTAAATQATSEVPSNGASPGAPPSGAPGGVPPGGSSESLEPGTGAYVLIDRKRSGAAHTHRTTRTKTRSARKARSTPRWTA